MKKGLNNTEIIGNVGSTDAVLGTTTSGTPVANFSVAVNDSYKGRDGNKKETTTWFKVSIYGKRARRAAKSEQEDMGQMVVTMQETFAGIRVIKSFAREDYQDKIFRRSNRLQFDNAIRIVRAMELTGNLVETIAAVGVGLALLYVYFSNVGAARFLCQPVGKPRIIECREAHHQAERRQDAAEHK